MYKPASKTSKWRIEYQRSMRDARITGSNSPRPWGVGTIIIIQLIQLVNTKYSIFSTLLFLYKPHNFNLFNFNMEVKNVLEQFSFVV